jgi:hypothetical protein
MKKFAFLSALLVFGFFVNAQTRYMGTDNSVLSFFSHTSMEDIAGTNKTCKAIVLEAETGKFVCQADNKGFIFKSGLMQEHYNENYMETEKFKYSKFSGVIPEKVDYTKDGVYKVTLDGKMDIHGVVKDLKIPASITVKGDVVTVDAKFNVAMKDYNIRIPEAVGNKFAEAMEVTVKAELKKK